MLRELLQKDDVVEEQWAGTEKNRHPNGPYLGSFAITKACYFNPFSVPQHTSKKERNDLMEFFIEAQIDEIDPLKLVTVMTFHPETEMRNQGLSLGCMVLQEAFSDLQSAYLEHQKPDLHLQRTMRFQFHIFRQLVSKALDQEGDILVQKTLMEMMQHLCEDHHSGLQDFVGEDLDDEDDDDKDDEDQIGGPDNLVQWICETLRVTLDTMDGSQEWQASMARREPYNLLLKQLFDTATEVIQGPHQENQGKLLETGMCKDIPRLSRLQRHDEFQFRSLMQDNESLSDEWMQLLRAQREAEIT